MLPPWAVVTTERRAHIERVVAQLAAWAAGLGVAEAEAERWRRAGWMHDALRDAPAATELDHGPLCADRLAQEGERDRGVLEAVRFHSVGYAGWDAVGRMLYLADYLEPGRTFEAPFRSTLRDRMPQQREAVLREAARRRIEWVLESGWCLRAETVAFWNALVSA
jgi:HD superfamily phosphohydrolase YqeK